VVGLGVVAAAAVTGGTVGCGSRAKTAPFSASPAKGAALPLGIYPASPRMEQLYGIVEWRSFIGRAQVVITGYRADGSPARGMQIAWFRSATGAPGHVRMMMLDGSGSTLRRDVNGKKTGSISALQLQLVHSIEYDLQRAMLPATSDGVKGAAFGGAGVHVLAVDPAGLPRTAGTGTLPLASAGGPHLRPLTSVLGPPEHPPVRMLDGTSPGSGPQCTEAWDDPSIPVDGASCIFGAATFEDGLGALEAIASCAQLNVDIQQAKQTCSNEDAANCNSDGTCNYGGQPEAAAAPEPQSQCDSECLCANYPDTAQGCSTNYGPCVGDYQCSGGYTCQGTPGGGSNTCQAPDGGVSDDGGTGNGDDAGAGSGDDAGDPGSGDDGGGGVDPGSGDDGGGGGGVDPGSGDDGGGGGADPGSGDDGGAGDDPEAPPTDDQLDQDTSNETCPSCQGSGTDINADPSNGGVSTTTGDPNDPTGSSSGSTSDQNDDGTGGGPGASSGGDQGSSGGGVGGGSSGGDDGTGDATQDQPTQDQGTQDQPAQDQGTQDQGTQDQGSQDQPAQDQASQDQSSQDQPAQDSSQDSSEDALRPHHHRHHKKSGWKRLYDKISTWLQ
jgi:hypothetical protein